MPKSDAAPSPTARTGRKAGHASSACEGCRKKKAKCDEKRPYCTRCISSGTTCTWTAEKDGRTTLGRCEPLLAEIAHLQAENAALKAIIAGGMLVQSPEALQTASARGSPPRAPDALLDPLSVEPLFAQPPSWPGLGPDYDTGFYFSEQPFEMAAPQVPAHQPLALAELPQSSMDFVALFSPPGVDDAFLLPEDIYPQAEYAYLSEGR